MKILKILGAVLIVAVVMTFGSEIGERISLPGVQRLVPTSEAIVGRPLTPVSVAGVARRTVRRCAVGVYHCGLPGHHSLEALLGHSNYQSIPLENFKPGTGLDRSEPAAG